MFVESYTNESDFRVELQTTLLCNEQAVQIDAGCTEDSTSASFYDTTERLSTARRFCLSADDTEFSLKQYCSRYDGANSEFYVDESHSISRFVKDAGLPSDTISGTRSTFGASSGLVVMRIPEPSLESAITTLAQAARALQPINLEQLALLVNFRGEAGKGEGCFECKIRVVFSPT